jgi:CCR4-NOT transcription complex subunit 7/8
MYTNGVNAIKDPPSGQANQIKEVWADNLDEEFKAINELVEKYPYVGMDTEYPGIYSPFQNDNTNKDAGYRFIKTNVDQLKLIQVGLTLSDENGETPSPICTWQFNFKFNLGSDKYVADSIN